MPNENVETDVETDVSVLDPEDVSDADVGDFGIVEENPDAEPVDAKVDDEPSSKDDSELETESEPETSPEVEPDKTPVKPPWDKGRQAKDQEIAGLKKQNAKLTEALATKGDGEAEPKAGVDTLDLDSELPELDEFADEDARIARINLLTRRDRARAARDSQKSNQDAYDAILDECDKEFGAEFHNDAVTRLNEVWADEGFGPENYPDAASTKLAVRGIYAELQNVQLRQPKPTKKTTSSPKPDPGRGGTVARKVSAGMMSMDEAVNDMDASGDLDWAK